ncbi:hypothetical protein H8959_008522 [Pygathrix nigripes]
MSSHKTFRIKRFLAKKTKAKSSHSPVDLDENRTHTHYYNPASDAHSQLRNRVLEKSLCLTVAPTAEGGELWRGRERIAQNLESDWLNSQGRDSDAKRRRKRCVRHRFRSTPTFASTFDWLLLSPATPQGRPRDPTSAVGLVVRREPR